MQSDWGGGYRNVFAYLNNNGISHRVFFPHRHEHNGNTERKHRHVVDTGLALLKHASLPLTYWSYAFETANFLVSGLPTSTLQTSFL